MILVRVTDHIAIHSMDDDDSYHYRFLTIRNAGAYHHENNRMIPRSYDSMTSRYSLPSYPFIGQLFIAIPTNRSTPHSMLVAPRRYRSKIAPHRNRPMILCSCYYHSPGGTGQRFLA